MSPSIRALVIGFVVALAVSFGVSFLETLAHAQSNMPIILGAGLGILAAYIAGNLAGNRKVALADEPTKKAALSLSAPPGLAMVLIFREGFAGRAAGLNIALDGREIAQLKAPRFTAVNVAPGAHTITAAFAGLAGPQNTPGQYTVSLQAGEVAVLRLSLSMGLLKNAIAIASIGDLAQIKAKLAGMPMVVATPPA